MSDDNPCALTADQKKAFQALKRAFKKCSDAGLIVWDNYGAIEAVNGHRVTKPSPDSVYPHRYESSHGSWFTPDCLGGSNADDPLYYDDKD